MITSTSINAAFIAKLVHAANVAIACESYCEIRTSKGKPSVLVEYDKQDNALLFTHVSGNDVTSICWAAIKQFITLPSVAQTIEQDDTEPSSYGFIQAYLLFVLLGIMVALGVLSYGIALLTGALTVVSFRLMPFLSGTSYTGSAESYSELAPQ